MNKQENKIEDCENCKLLKKKIEELEKTYDYMEKKMGEIIKNYTEETGCQNGDIR